ncbi:hypothetical protein SAMN05428970_2007 [Agromyces sp. CF514]|uniref:hypothetical protein n=1 Tax=Agromyces sp. CF514 TaxID=1881031 RepID=UPI0008E7E5AD|nr:hypothetical protein [Agromyces sp. CF514]SFR76040.1 hypothetical protein SAMN05428970_2007 [Agromyces sp. CF514]
MITGQVGLIPQDGYWFSRLIAWVTGSQYTHIVVAINENQCVSAEPGGARVRPISFYPGIVWSRYPLRTWQRRRIVRYAVSRIGTPYATADFIAAGIAIITRTRTPDWLAAYVEDDERLICSQLCDLALQAGNIHVFHDYRPAGAVVPSSFEKVFRARGWL